MIAFGDIVVVGGGCYGTFYVGQLLRARSRGEAAWQRLIAVDRDRGCRLARENPNRDDVELRASEWGAFFDEYLGAGHDQISPDAIVPSPLMPHLMFEWLLRSARRRWPGREVEAGPLTLAAETPYDVLHADGTRYMSFAD